MHRISLMQFHDEAALARGGNVIAGSVFTEIRQPFAVVAPLYHRCAECGVNM